MDEVDLMLLMIAKPSDPNPDGSKVNLTLTGDLKLWTKKTKEVEETRREFALSELSPGYNPFYVEVLSRSQNVRDLAIQVEYRGQTDTVRATAVWAWAFQVIHDQTSAAALFAEWPDMDNPLKARIGFYGGTGLRPINATIGVRNLIAFKFIVAPDGIGREPGVKFDATRQMERMQIARDPIEGWQPVMVEYFPQGDVANDDRNNVDESVAPSLGGYFYSEDPPGPESDDSNSWQAVYRGNMLEFVRVRFDGVRPGFDPETNTYLNNIVDGSRSSVKFKWHFRHWLLDNNGKWRRSTYDPVTQTDPETEQNDIGPFHVADAMTIPGN